jgi:hypothetical protein
VKAFGKERNSMNHSFALALRMGLTAAVALAAAPLPTQATLVPRAVFAEEFGYTT